MASYCTASSTPAHRLRTGSRAQIRARRLIVATGLTSSEILREGTHAAHERAEHSKGAQWLARGELDKQEYVRFLMMLYHVYK